MLSHPVWNDSLDAEPVLKQRVSETTKGIQSSKKGEDKDDLSVDNDRERITRRSKYLSSAQKANKNKLDKEFLSIVEQSAEMRPE